MAVNLKAIARQANNVTLGTNGDDVSLSSTMLGELFTADWKQNLQLAGKLWRVTAGTLADGAGPVMITGGGNGTYIDLDQPEMLVNVPVGYYLFLAEAHIVALPAMLPTGIVPGDVASILIISDRTAASNDGTSTAETPDNLHDGGGAFPGRAYSAYTADVTDPVMAEILALESRKFEVGTAVSLVQSGLKLDYEPKTPSLLAGPCQICVYWGTTSAAGAAVGGCGSIVVGCVPASWYPVI